MNKEWKCEDCCVLGTDACYYGVREGNNHACSQLVADHDKAYQQGKEDTWADIEKIINGMTNPIDTMKIIIEQLKEQKNE